MKIKDKVTVVTGDSRGIGKATVLALPGKGQTNAKCCNCVFLILAKRKQKK
jgi:NAD(P)-dependent dehydrogenase (short-subunit alcohol dehydrogenase family)